MAPLFISSELLRVLRDHQRAIKKLTARKAKDLHELTQEAALDARREIRTIARGSFTSVDTRSRLAQLKTITNGLGRQLGKDVGDLIEDTGLKASDIGRRSLVRHVDAQIKQFGLREINLQFAGDLLDRGLLEHYKASTDFYGQTAIRKMRLTMAQGVLRGWSLAETWEKIADDLNISEGRAERIVRTETSLATHRRQLLDMRELDDGADEWWKQLVTLFDNRTAADSIPIHGQRRRLRNRFTRVNGDTFDHPPDRPNDRGTFIFVPIVSKMALAA